MGKVCYT